MKKIVLAFLMLALSTGVAFARQQRQDTLNFKGFLDVVGNYGFSRSLGSSSTNVGITLAAEYLHAFTRNTKIGAGMEVMLPRGFSMSGLDSPRFSFLPVYATIQMSPLPGNRDVFFKFNLGYSIIANLDNTSRSRGGVYWALGGGYDFSDSWFLEVMYKVYNGSARVAGINFDTDYRVLSLGIGRRFNI